MMDLLERKEHTTLFANGKWLACQLFSKETLGAPSLRAVYPPNDSILIILPIPTDLRDMYLCTPDMTENKHPKAAVVVVDWARCTRVNNWKEELAKLNPELIDFERCMWVPLADSPTLQQQLHSHEILIFNFDAINGDPAFGSDFALRWLQLHHPRVLRWVKSGGILIVEGQTMLSVPTQDSYDALFGHREFFVSGPSDRPLIGLEWKRTGADCRITAQARKLHLLGGQDRFTCKDDLGLDSFFPGDARLMIQDDDHDRYGRRVLYRGWFSRLPALSRQHRWTPLIETDHSHSTNYPVLMGTQLNKGVIFVSTMLLAGTGPTQSQLIRSLIDWNTEENPLSTSEPLSTKIRGFVEPTVKTLISIAAGFVSTRLLKTRGSIQGAFLQFLCWATFSLIWFGILWLGARAWKKAMDFLGT